MEKTPREFLKARRPQQFSDTVSDEESSIGRLELEYYLSTLSNRSQEAEFEGFAKRMCELGICPNLVPMTGPTGGGDGKVDSETHPVSDKTALSWYVGEGRKASKERWAFAFSVKEDWRSKVQSDVKKIAETKRGYKKAIFVSSRFIPNREKAEVQDNLKKKYKISVTILDRNWLLDEVFDKNRQDVAVEKLHIQATKQSVTKKGPLDSRREEDLQELDKKIETSIADDKVSMQVVDDAIESAILSRQLERSRSEIDGRFDRAVQLANQYGTEFSQFEAIYQFAWTTFWWHEDFVALVKLYREAEKKVIGTGNVYNFERLMNLWNLLTTAGRKDKKAVTKKFYDDHTTILEGRLEELSKDEGKPSSSLYAKTLLLEMKLQQQFFAGLPIDDVLEELKQVVLGSKGLVGFPFKPLVDILTELSEALEDSAEYNDLFEAIVDTTAERDGERAAGELVLERARKLMSRNQPYVAIRSLGIALWKLHKYESRDAAVVALYLMGNAYRDVGLYWAARGSFLSAASLATADFWNHDEVNGRQLLCYDGLRWVELKLGRLPELLEWHKIDGYARGIMATKISSPEKLAEQSLMFDLALGAMFLRCSPAALKKYEKLPDLLLEVGLEHSQIALLYALGHEEALPKDFTDAVSEDEREEYFANWAEQYSEDIHPERLTYTEGEMLELRSVILGCEVVVTTDRREHCLETAESILAALESFLATANLKHASAKEPMIRIKIVAAEGEGQLIDYAVDDDAAQPTITVKCRPFDPHKLTESKQNELFDQIFKIIAETTARLVIFKDFEKDMLELMRDEGIGGRAINFTCSYVRIGNVLGYTPKRKIDEWNDTKNRPYPLKRDKRAVVLPPLAPLKPEGKKGEPTTDPFSTAKHTDMKVISVIRDNLWNKAGWQGMGYLIARDRPPIICFSFENIEYGRKIFAAWRGQFGQADENDIIRLTILKDISKSRPYDYRVGITANITADLSPAKLVASTTRRCTMTPESSANLDNFLGAYEAFECFWLAPAAVGAGGMPDVDYSMCLLKREINIRKSSDVGEHEVDSPLLNTPD